MLVPALPPYLIEPIWQQFSALLPERVICHPLGCHRSRIPDRIVFEKLVQILVFGCAYERIADETCSATKRWVVERTSSWHNAHKKLVWCTERRGKVVDFWVAFSEVVIIVCRLIREGFRRYRWEARSSRQP
jgi:transposase